MRREVAKKDQNQDQDKVQVKAASKAQAKPLAKAPVKVQEKQMATTKAKATAAKDEAPEKEADGAPDSPLPLLDLNDAGVKKMIKQAKKRGFVTFDQLNDVLPSESTSPEQIEDVMSMLSEMGINVVESEDAEADEEEKQEEPEEEPDTELVEITQRAVAETKKSEPGE